MSQRTLLALILLCLSLPLPAQPQRPAPDQQEVVPWGDLVFLDAHTLVAPYAIVERASAEDRRHAARELEHWQHDPVEEVVETLGRSGGGGDALSRALTRLFVEAVREHPDMARRQIASMRRVRELGLRILDIDRGTLEERRRIPIWHGLARVEDRLEQVPGQSETRVPLANLRVGVRLGQRYLVAWVARLPGAASVFLDRNTLETVHLARGFVPLAWVTDEQLLGWRRNDRGQPMIGIYRLAGGENAGLHALTWKPGHAGVQLTQVRPLYTGAPPQAAVLVPGPERGPHERAQQAHAAHMNPEAPRQALLCAGARLWQMDLHSGRREAIGRDRLWMGCPLAAGPFLWAVADMAGGPRLIRLETKGRNLRPSGHWPVPRSGFWFAPAAFDGTSLWLFRDAGIRGPARGGGSSTTTSRQAEAWRFTVFMPGWKPTGVHLPLDSAKAYEGARLIAISPGGAWLAWRANETQIRLLPLAR